MPVRGSSQWTHAIHEKKVINHDQGGTYVMCAWDTCENPGFECHKVRTKQHAEGYAETDERYMNYVFCSERHKQYWLFNAQRPGKGNNLPPGMKLGIL
jgi:hypothetical protein